MPGATFQHFNERARGVLRRANEAAVTLDNNSTDTEHVLLGLLDIPDSTAFRMLEMLHVAPETLRQTALKRASPGKHVPTEEIGLSPGAKRVIELAVSETRRSSAQEVGTEHLFLGLILEEQGVAAQVLLERGITLERAREAAGAARAQSQEHSKQGLRHEEAAMKRNRGDEQPLFDRYTERARKVIQLAEEEAKRFNHNYIGTEHILLGLVREGEGVAAKVLGNLGVELPKVQNAVEFIIGRGQRQVTGEIGLTPRAKKVLELARDEARRLGHHYIGTEHILLGLIREGEGIAAGVLESMGVSLGKVRSEVLKVVTMGGEASMQFTSPPPPIPASPVVHWEYLVMQVAYRDIQPYVRAIDGKDDAASTFDHAQLHLALQLLGVEGWELVAVDPTSTTESGLASLYIFKRGGAAPD